jgi:lauroyl/myristoyl acyltransferase
MNAKTLSSESLRTTLSTRRNYGFAALFSNTFWAIARTLMVRDEIKVSIQQLRNGERVWHVYDPMIGRTESFFSEIEALRWIERKSRRYSAIED